MNRSSTTAKQTDMLATFLHEVSNLNSEQCWMLNEMLCEQESHDMLTQLCESNVAVTPTGVRLTRKTPDGQRIDTQLDLSVQITATIPAS